MILYEVLLMTMKRLLLVIALATVAFGALHQQLKANEALLGFGPEVLKNEIVVSVFALFWALVFNALIDRDEKRLYPKWLSIYMGKYERTLPR